MAIPRISRALLFPLLCMTLGCGDDLLLIDARDGALPLADGGLADGGVAGDASMPTDGGSEMHPALYGDGLQSPLTPSVVAHLKEVRERGPDLRDDAFSKVGASATVSRNFFQCFDRPSPNLGGRTLGPTLDHFHAGEEGSSFGRTSEAATVGWHAGRALEGEPSALENEVATWMPGFAVVMYGTNDINIVGPEDYAENLLNLTDALLEEGTVPLMSSVMPRGDDAEANARVPLYNMVVRAIAQARQVPFIDYHQALLPLMDQGLAGDGIHPNAFSGGACVLTDEGLRHGYNQRNLLTLQALDRLRRSVLEDEGAPDAPGPALGGSGTMGDPWQIPALPFVHSANTLFSEERNLDRYSGCMSDANEEGPEYLYRLELSEATEVRIQVFDRGDVDIDVHLMDGLGEGDCVERAHQVIERRLQAGTHYLSLDSFVARSGEERAGEYLLVVMER